MQKTDLNALADRVEVIGVSAASIFGSSNHHISGRTGDIEKAAHCLATAHYLRAIAAQENTDVG